MEPTITTQRHLLRADATKSFVESTDLSIGEIIQREWVDNRKATFEDIAHQALFLLDLKGEYRKTFEKEGLWT